MRWSSAWVCAWLVACGGASAPREHAARSGETDRAQRIATVEMLWLGGPQISFLARGEEGDCFVHEGMRLVMRDGRSEVADDTFAGTLFAASHEGGRWWLLASDGTLWTAPTFLARPVRAGRIDLPDFAPAGTSQEGLLLLSPTPAGDLHRVIGGVARRIEGLPRGGVLGGAFLDARRGIALLDGGVLARTDDGGATWAPLRARDAIVGVHAIGDRYRLIVSGDERRLRMAHDGTSEDLDVELARTDSMSPLEAIRAMVDLALPASGMIVAPLAGPALAVTEQLRSAPADRDVFVLPNGRLPSTSDRLPAATTAAFLGPRLSRTLVDAFEPLDWGGTTSGCQRRAWGRGAASWCAASESAGSAASGEPHLVLHRIEENGDSERTDVVIPTASFRLLADGRGLAWAGGCAPTEAGESHRGRICWVPDVTAPQPIDVRTTERVASGAGDWLLVERRRRAQGSDDDDENALGWNVEYHGPIDVDRELVHREHGRRRAVTRALPDLPRGYTIETAAITSDAKLAVVARTTGRDGEYALFLGDPAGPLERRALPRGVTRDVAFGDAHHGIAIGRSASEIHRTLDGGRTWEHVPLPIDGDASLVPLSDGDAWAQPFCLPSRCGARITSIGEGGRVGHASVWIDGFGPMRASTSHRVLVADRGPRRPPSGVDTSPRWCGEPSWFGDLACDPPVGGGPSGATEGSAAPSASGGARTFFVPAGIVDVSISGAPGRSTARFRWSGQDDAGPFDGAAGPFPAWRIEIGEERDGVPTMRPLAATRHGVLFVERIGESALLRFARVGDRRAARAFPSHTELGRVELASLPSADGRVALVRTQIDWPRRVDVTVLAADGTVEQSRTFVFAIPDDVPSAAPPHVGVARDGTRFFVVAPIGDSPSAWRVYPMDRAELPRTYGSIGGALPVACPDASASGLVALVPSFGLTVDGQPALDGGVELDLAPDRVCIRAVHWRHRYAADATGHLVGPRIRASRPLECTLRGATRHRRTDCED